MKSFSVGIPSGLFFTMMSFALADTIPQGSTTASRARSTVDSGWSVSTPSTATTLDELVLEEPPGDVSGRTGGQITTTKAPHTSRDHTFSEIRPNYLINVTLPWTISMVVLLLFFLWVMRTDGPVYKVLTRSYEPPAARQQAAEELRRERLEETQRTAANVWESERARWSTRTSLNPPPPAASSPGSSSSKARSARMRGHGHRRGADA